MNIVHNGPYATHRGDRKLLRYFRRNWKVRTACAELLREINVLDSLCGLFFTGVDTDVVNVSLSEGSMQSLNSAGKRQRGKNTPLNLSVRDGKAKIAERRSGMKWKC